MTFGPNWFNRREQMEPDHLDLVFGGRANWEPADRERPNGRTVADLAGYIPRGATAGGLPLPAAVRDRSPHRPAALPGLRDRARERGRGNERGHVGS